MTENTMLHFERPVQVDFEEDGKRSLQACSMTERREGFASSEELEG